MLHSPALATPAEWSLVHELVQSDSWVMEQKLDGHRILLTEEGRGHSVALSRDGSAYTKELPRAMREFRFPPGEWQLDGELVGKTYWVFDIVQASGPLYNMDLPYRHAMLDLFFDATKPPFRRVPQAITTEEKARLVEMVIAQGLEGIVAKKADSVYPAGRSRAWLKFKQVSTADVIVTSVHDDGKESAAFAALDLENNRIVDLGRCSLIGKPAVSPGNVIEVRYLYVGANGHLYQPTLLRKRDDKPMHQCTTDQLRHVNKAVLASLTKE